MSELIRYDDSTEFFYSINFFVLEMSLLEIEIFRSMGCPCCGCKSMFKSMPISDNEILNMT
jgi:hypothetical protein